MEIEIKLTRNIFGKPVAKVKLVANQWNDEKDVKTLKMGETMKLTCGVRPKDQEHSGRGFKSTNPPIYVTGDMLEWDYNLMEV